MFLRNFLLALGGIACIAGIGLVVVWLYRPTPATNAETATFATDEILVTTRALPAGTLLRSEDLDWKAVPAAAVLPGSYMRGQIVTTDLIGAVVTHDFASGEALIASALVRPNERGFLGAVLLPGNRAVSIAVDAPESASGLLMPGDRVDVILTQSFGDGGGNPGHRSVGETVLHDIRVVAVDQTMSPPAKVNVSTSPGSADSRIPKTVTLEVNEHDAEKLLVATQLGRVELAIRALGPANSTPPPDQVIRATWASDVSPALLALGAPPVAAPQTGKPPPHTGIEIMRGSKVELR
jgi:pilus assembly protein CpaB